MKLRNAFIAVVTAMAMTANAQNPFVQTWCTSDPAPMVHDGTMYIYTGHDEDGADFFWMQEWRVYSTQDMVNWQDHGSPLALESFSWADDRAWASQTIERDGKFYWYICAHSKLSGGMAIGVAVGDSPTGPFKDAIGKPLFENGSWDHIDPTVMIDDDGQAWLMWGNPRVYYLKLNRDMISYSGELGMLDMTEEGFGSPLRDKRVQGKEYKDSYVEGPWLRKVDSKKYSVDASKVYQLLYAAGGVPEHISYSTAPSPTGPWTYAGEIMPLCDTGSFTNHCGVADYKGHSYFFYHTGKLPNGGGFGRSVAVEEFKYNADGSFPTIMPTDEGVKPVDKFNPYRKVEAETMAFSKGIKTEQNEEVGVYVTDIHNGDWIKLQNVAFDNKYPRVFKARVASGLRGGQIEIHLDSVGGRCLGVMNVPGTGGWEKWETISLDLDYPTLADVNGPKRTLANIALPETADLYLVFKGRKGPKLFNFDWWEMRGLEQVNMPLFQTKYTADPSPLVVGDTLFLYTSHDASPEDIPDANEKNSAGFFMYDWLLWSTTDMVNWTEHGAVASLKEFSWRSRENGAWAIQTIERNGHYYMGFASTCCPEGLGYAMSDSPLGPWKEQNYLMAPTQRDRGNHPGIADYKGHSYLFGQDYDLMHLETFVHHERRSVNGAEIFYNADGTIRETPYWLDLEPMKQLEWLNPYNRIEAETMAWGFGLKTAKMGIENTGVVADMPASTGKKNMYVFDIDDGEYIRLRGVDFSQGAKQFSIMAASTGGCTVSLRLDSKDGQVVGVCNIGKTGDVEKYRLFTGKVKSAAGVHDVYLCFSNVSGDVRLDWWQVKK